LQPGGAAESYLRSLRLQALDQINLERLRQLTKAAGKPKLLGAQRIIERMIEEEKHGYETL